MARIALIRRIARIELITRIAIVDITAIIDTIATSAISDFIAIMRPCYLHVSLMKSIGYVKHDIFTFPSSEIAPDGNFT